MKSIGKLFLTGLMVVVLQSVIQIINISAEEALCFIHTAALRCWKRSQLISL